MQNAIRRRKSKAKLNPTPTDNSNLVQKAAPNNLLVI